MRGALKLALSGALCAALARPDTPPLHGGALLVDDGATLRALEDRGFSFERVVGARRLADITRVVERDVAEFTRGAAPDNPRRPFKPEWLSRGRFELIGVVNRIDRRAFEPAACGEVRLVYRLALENRGRKATRLPMTVNVRIPQPRVAGDCRAVASSWLAGGDLEARLRDLGPPSTIEINYQSIHVPSTRTDMDDNAEYVLRAFRVEGDALVEDHLFNTPRADLDDRARSELALWIRSHLDAIDRGQAVIPDAFLATRIVSRSPRGHMHAQNRPISTLLAKSDETLAWPELATLEKIRTPELLARRLDEMTCAGCHQTRSVAGFHLLGEERDESSFNALAVGHSPHLGADLEWRAVDLAGAAKGEPEKARPFAAFPDGHAGAECGLSKGLAAWRCDDGLACRDLHHGAWGVCSRPGSSAPGEPCEDVIVTPSDRVEGALVVARGADATCPAPTGSMERGAFCAPNWLGFTGGMCSERCGRVGELRRGAICASLPSAGYEADCFFGDQRLEACLARHAVSAWIASCDAVHPCRDDYGCARVPHAPPGIGACVPPYFVFQARVDGPERDR